MKKLKTFSGGYTFSNYSGQPEDRVISLELPQKVIIPLKQGFGIGLKPEIEINQKVQAGQIIARDDNKVSSPIHATINGKVSKIEKMNYFKQEINMVVIEGDGSEDYQRLEGFQSDWEKLEPEKIEELIYLSGVSSLDREGIPTRFKSSVIEPPEVKDLIIHGVSSEAYNISLEILLQGKNLIKFIEGIRILHKIMPQSNLHIAVNSYKSQVIEQLEKLTSKFQRLNIHRLEPKYPQGYDEMLVPTILNKKFPYGYSAANIGVVVLNIQAVLSVYEAVAEGKPLIERIIALCGSSWKERLHLKVRIGTPLEFIIRERLRQDSASRLVLNSLLTGVKLNDFSLPLDRTFSQLIALPDNKERKFLAFLRPGLRYDSYSRSFISKWLKSIKKDVDTNLNGELRPCIMCGYCQEVCPVNIIPHLINRYVERNIIEESLMRLEIFNCIDCNLCSFVCPCKIPLANNIKMGKEKLIEIGCDQSLCILPRFNLKGLEEYRGVKSVR